jgi:hypothetical protein
MQARFRHLTLAVAAITALAAPLHAQTKDQRHVSTELAKLDSVRAPLARYCATSKPAAYLCSAQSVLTRAMAAESTYAPISVTPAPAPVPAPTPTPPPPPTPTPARRRRRRRYPLRFPHQLRHRFRQPAARRSACRRDPCSRSCRASPLMRAIPRSRDRSTSRPARTCRRRSTRPRAATSSWCRPVQRGSSISPAACTRASARSCSARTRRCRRRERG